MSAGPLSIARGAQARRWALRDGAARLALVLLALLAALPTAPVFQRAPEAAAGAALTAGAEILRGRVLYQDVWLNTPPLGAALNALGLALGGPGRWGIWALELAAILAAALLLYTLLRRDFPVLPALFGTAALLANLVFLYPVGGTAAVYALPLQAGAYLLARESFHSPKPGWNAFWMGILCGLLFSLRLELAGVGLTLAALLVGAAVYTRRARLLLCLPLMALGVLLVIAAWAVVFAAQGALPALLDQVFRYNVFYSGITNLIRVAALGEALEAFYWASGFFALSALAYLVALPFLVFTNPRFRAVVFARWMGLFPLVGGLLLLFNGLWDDRAGSLYDFSALSSYRLGLLSAGALLVLAALPFLAGWAAGWERRFFQRFAAPYQAPPLLFPLALALVDLPAHLLFSSLTGQGLSDHYLPVLPALAILMGFLVWSLRAGGASPASSQNAVVWLGLLALPVLVTGLITTMDGLRAYADDQTVRIAKETRAATRPDQPILQWGENPQLYLLADRSPASRFFAQRALFRPGYASAERVQAFVEDLYATPPVILVDTRPVDMPLALPASQDCENLQYDDFVEQTVRAERDARFPLLRGEPLPYYPAEMKAVYRWVCENYELVSETGADLDAWRVYRKHPGKP